MGNPWNGELHISSTASLTVIVGATVWTLRTMYSPTKGCSSGMIGRIVIRHNNLAGTLADP
jgi:hypothetical protein